MKRKKKPESPTCKSCKGILVYSGVVYAVPLQEQKFVCKECGKVEYKRFNTWTR